MRHPKDIPTHIDPIAIPRAKVLGSDKVRYRVYRTPDESVVVVAENALMAMRLAEIAEPFRIERDLMSDSFATAEEIEREETPSIILNTALSDPPKPLALDAEHMPQPTEEPPFVPIKISALDTKQQANVRFLSPDMLAQLWEKDAVASIEPEQTDQTEVEAEALPSPPEEAVQPDPLPEPLLPISEAPMEPDEVARLLESGEDETL